MGHQFATKFTELAFSLDSGEAFTERLYVSQTGSSRLFDLGRRKHTGPQNTRESVVHAGGNVNRVVDTVHGARIKAKRRFIALIVLIENEWAVESHAKKMHVRAFMGERLQNFQGGFVTLRVHHDGTPKAKRGDAMKSDLFVSVAIGEDHFFQERANFALDLRSTRVKEREGLASNGQNMFEFFGG